MTIMEKGVLARALYTNRPEAKNELFFRKGDILTVIEYDHDGQPGWWLCALRGQRGICPSNYLEVLEDKYSVPTKNNLNTTDSKSCIQLKDESSRKGKDEQLSLSVNPLETYDFPRSVGELNVNANNSGVDKGKSKSCAALLTHCGSGFSLGNSTSGSAISLQQQEPVLEHTYSNEEPLYENDCVSGCVKEEETSFSFPQSNPLELYDVPRSDLPLLGQSISRLRKYGSCSDDIDVPNSLKQDNSSTKLSTTTLGRNLRGRKPLGLSTSPPPTSGSGYPPVQLRRPHRQPHFSGYQAFASSQIHSNRSSSAESGIVMPNQMQVETNPADLYDVPRGSSQTSTSSVANLVQAFNSKGTGAVAPTVQISGSSRPSSALSVTSSGMGLSIATSDSKDSLDGLYDVPRTSIKAYVSHMETKYDELARHRNDSCSSSTASLPSQTREGCHTRHNSTSSIFSAYGYSGRNPNGGRGSISGASVNGESSTPTSTLGRNQSYHGQSVDELYDVPRGTMDHPIAQARMGPPQPPSRKPLMGSIAKSNGSLNQDGSEHDDPMQFYDVPAEFARKVGMDPHQIVHKNNDTFKRGVSSTSLSSISSSASRSRSGSIANGRSRGSDAAAADVKILPLCPKAAVSVCEKLRQEVVSSIGSILNHVKPKWRSKENLQEIMPDLKFSCTRLCLAIKDVADFASRSLSNAKRLPDDSSISVRLHRLLTPVINGSQIIQRDVDELEAYFWSIDRLSSSGENASHHGNASGDALDQLILCSRSLKHDVTELANFLALHSSALYKEAERPSSQAQIPSTSGVSKEKVVAQPETRVEDSQEDYDYVSLIPNGQTHSQSCSSSNDDDEVDSQKLSSTSGSTSTVSWHLDSRDQQLLEFYSAQISVTAPQLSLSISTFISAIQQNEPPSVFNIHLKYVILLAYKLLFAGDTVHRNIGSEMLKEEVENKANDLHKSILALYEASKVATVEFPKIGPMQAIVDRVWGTTQAATQLKKVIFNAVYTAV